MAQLTIEGLDVRVADAPQDTEAWGDQAPAFSGRMRSDIRAHHRTYRFTTPILDLSDAIALRTLLQSPGPLSCSGDQIGTEADFHVTSNQLRPVTATDAIVTFSLRETTDLASSPLLFSFDGDAEGSYTFTRTGTAYYIDSDGVLQSAAENIARFSYPLVDGVRTPALLLEAGRSNIVGSDDFSTWTDQSTCAVTASVADPAGATGAYTLTGDGGAAAEARYVTPTFTGDAAKSALFVVKEETMPASGNQRLAVYDQTAAAFRLNLEITSWVAGEPQITASTGTLLGKQFIGDGWWIVYGGTTTVTAANSNRVYVYSNVDASAGAISVYRVNAFNASAPPVMPVAASGSVGTETLYAPFTHAPQAVTIYVKMAAHRNVGTAGVVQIGTLTGSADERVGIQFSSSRYRGIYNNGSGLVTASATTEPARDVPVELMLQLASDGDITLHQSVDGGTAETATDTTGGAPPSAWDSQRIYIGSLGGASQGFMEAISVKIASGTKTMAEMRTLSAARLHPRTR